MAMPESYVNVVTALETLDEDDLTLERVKNRLLETELKQAGKGVFVRNPELKTPISFNTERKIIYFKCGKPGHKSNKCRSRRTNKASELVV